MPSVSRAGIVSDAMFDIQHEQYASIIHVLIKYERARK
jgi:hypothetical protein